MDAATLMPAIAAVARASIAASLRRWSPARVDFGAVAPHSIDIGNALALPQPGA